MSARAEAIRSVSKKKYLSEGESNRYSGHFNSKVFHRRLVEGLPKEAAHNWLSVLDGNGRLDPAHADQIAESLKRWAIKHGATHFTHWFQPLINVGAEKRDSFLSWGENGIVLGKFKGRDLLRGEPDVSSFPFEELRTTHAVKGYTAWDPTVFPFLWESGDGLTLCIPSVFFSWKGEALDHRIPLIRSEEKLEAVVLKLIRLTGGKAERIFSTLRIEQEYFAIDRTLFLLRPDLVLSGRTVFGARSPKDRELEDRYFGSVKDRALTFMREFEDAAIQIGIPVKTHHNAMAPAQHAVTSLCERASLAIDHNFLLMGLMKGYASKHNLACLFHEKPFMGMNGSGKSNHWSIVTDTGQNLLDPQENSLVFITLITAILRACLEHGALFRASITSAGNDCRLGKAEVPPTIFSVYLGEALEKIVEGILHSKKGEMTHRWIDLGLKAFPSQQADHSSRNRSSFFAFTRNEFEFQAIGASAHCALPVTVIHATIADSLQLILDEMVSAIGDRKLSQEELFQVALPVLKKHLQTAQKIIFSGDLTDWEKEAGLRGLPNICESVDAFSQLIDKKAVSVFKDILSEDELHSRYEIFIEQFGRTLQIETSLMIELFQTMILPAAQKDMRERGIEAPLIEKAMQSANDLKRLLSQMNDMGWEARGKVFCELIRPKMAELRFFVDQLEGVVDHALWLLPKYREMLFAT